MKTFMTRHGKTDSLIGDRLGPEIEALDLSQAEQRAKEMGLILIGELGLTCTGGEMSEDKADEIALGLSESIPM